MMYAPVLVSRCAKVVVGRPFVGIDHRAWQNSFLNKRNKRSGVRVSYDFGDHRALSLKDTRDRDFADRPATLNFSRSNVFVHVFRLAAKETFISFDATSKRIAIFDLLPASCESV